MSTSTSASKLAPVEDTVVFESDSILRTYKLNRPSKLNALDEQMLDLLRPKIEEWSHDKLTQIVVGTGEGKAFCAGGDVATVVRHAADKKTRPHALQFFKKEFELDYILSTMPKPYVAVMDGFTMGGGVGLCVNAPFRIATEKTVFAMPETKIGYSPDVGASHFLSRLDGQLGTYLSLTGETIHGRAVYELGLATHFVSSRRVPELIARLAALEDVTYDAIDATIEEHHAERTVDDPAPVLQGDIRKALDNAFRANTVQEIVNRLNKLKEDKVPEVQEWAKATLATLELRSPTSLKVALHAIRKGTGLSLIDALQMELGIATAFCSGASPDFKTGVTAVIVEKMKGKPSWSPATLAEVPDKDIIFNFFDPASKFLKETPKLQYPEWLKNAQASNPMHYALPREEEIGSVVKGSDARSHDWAVTAEELVKKFETRRRGKAGVKEKVLDVVQRRCKVEPDSDGTGWLVWKAQ